MPPEIEWIFSKLGTLAIVCLALYGICVFVANWVDG
jgi:hypothetical protein